MTQTMDRPSIASNPRPPNSRARNRTSTTATVLLAFALYFALRLPHLRDLPVFCDEATYLDWAQIIQHHPLTDAFVSMQDAKLPLHYWLLAPLLSLHQDPVYLGRLLSVLFGAVTLFPLLMLCREFAKLTTAPRLLPTLALLFLITSPLLAFNQRLALAESLLVLQSITIAWLALRLARRAAEAVPLRRLLLDGCLLGIVWASTLLTKQNFSYALWILPPAAFLANARRGHLTQLLKKSLPPFSLASIIGIACFIPILLVPSLYSITSRLLYKSHFLRDVDHRGRFSILADNLLTLFVPSSHGHLQWWPYDPHAPLDQGWLYLYLTPPILLLALGAFAWFLFRSQWRPLVFLAAWAFALIAPLLLANISYSRYILLGFIPLLISAAWLLADLIERASIPLRKAATPAAILAVLAAIAWPLSATVASVANAHAPTLARADCFQHFSGYPCGDAGEKVVARLQQLAAEHPITVVTARELGIANEYIWVMLRNNPNVQLLREDNLLPLRSDRDSYLAMTRQWAPRPFVHVQIPPDRPIYVVSSGDRSPSGVLDVFPNASQLGSDARTVATCTNPPEIPGEAPTHMLAIIEIYSSRAKR
jgi:hypothetical protein